jgi:hypothetical protein
MRNKIFFLIPFLLIVNVSLAQKRSEYNERPRYKISLETTEGKMLKGLLIDIKDSSITVYSGNSNRIGSEEMSHSQKIDYSQIQQVKLKRRNGLINGIGIGAGIGILPALVGGIFGRSTGEGGAYVSVVTLPLGLITGTLIGATSRKKYNIHGDFSQFRDFQKRSKKI